MAKAESKTILKAYSTVESKLPTLPLEDGQLIFVYDKKKIILDNHGVRTVYEQIQTIETEEQRNDLLAPIDSFYFVIETSILWRYSNGHWNQITTSPQEQIDRIVAEGTKQVKAVRDEGQKVLQSIPEDFQTQMESKLDKQQGVENKGKVLVIGEDGNVVPEEVASGGGDGIAIINTMSGESPLVIPDSAERVNKRLELGGKTEQVQTTGAQLLPFPYVTGDMTKNGVTFAVQEDGGIKVTGTATEYVIFNIAKIDFGAESIFNNSTGNGKVLSGGKDNVKIEYHGLNKNTYLSVEKGLTVNTVIYPQLQNGNSATPYEPYTGGKPSPSPEYPQEIKNSGKWNEEKQKYEVDAKITGKNLFDIEKAKNTQNWFTSVQSGYSDFEIYVGKGNTVTISHTDTLEAGLGFYAGIVYKKDGAVGAWLYNSTNISANTKKVTFTANEDYVYIRCSTNDISKFTDNIKMLQVEIGETQTDFIQGKEQSITLTSDRPITKWDRLVEQGGEIGWLYGTKKYTVTGSESFRYGVESYYTGSSTNMFYTIIDATGSEGIMKDLPFVRGIWNYTDKEAFCVNVNQLHIRLYNKRIGVSDDATKEEKFRAYKEFMAKKYNDGTPFEVHYKTTKPEFIPLPQSEQNAIRALTTHYPTTVITADGGELDPDIKVTYTADTKNYVDNKFGKTINAMQTKLLELESRV